MASADIFYRGGKTFWKTHTRVDVLIVEHKQCDVLEIVCSNPATRQQAPRIYVNKSTLKDEIADEDIQSRVIALIEPILEKKQDFDRDVLLTQAWKTAICEYILERLELHKKFVGSKAFHVTLQDPLQREGTRAGATVTCNAPATLVGYDLPGFALPRESVLQLVQGVSAANTTRDHILSARDRLRIPFIFIKASKVKFLSHSEARIWKIVSLLILRDIEVHGRQAIINLESTSLCAEFAARQLARMRSSAIIPSSSNKYAKPPVLDNFLASSGSARYRDHRSKPSTPRFAEPDAGSTRSVSAKLGLDALASSVQRGLQSLGSSKHNGGKRSISRAAADQREELPRKKSMVSMMMGGKARRGSRADKPQPQRAPSRQQQQRASTSTTPRGGALSAKSASGFSDADDEEMGFGDDADSSPAHRSDGSGRKEWFGGMSKKFTGLVSGKLSGFGSSSKHRKNRVGVSTDDEDAQSLSHTAPTSSDGASVCTVDPAFAPVGGFGSTLGGFLGNLSGKHTASTVVKVKSAREKYAADTGSSSGKSVVSATAAVTPTPMHRVSDSTLAPAPQIFQHITMWGGRVVIRPATSKAQRDVVLRFK